MWSVSRGIAAPASLLKEVEAALTAGLEKTLQSKAHQQKAEELSLEPHMIKGAEYENFLKDNGALSTKKNDGVVTREDGV